jgi:serine/threonine protein kinase
LAINNSRNKLLSNRHTTLVSNSKRFPAADEYSDEIKDLVRACLNYDLSDRPTLQVILDAADGALSDSVSQADLMDTRGLGLELPHVAEFSIGAPVNGAKRIKREPVP